MTRQGSTSNTSGNEDTLFPRKFTLNSRGKLLLLDRPWVMGILNATPDSFMGAVGLAVWKQG
ncbi:dihydropteroate synthase [Nitritalea halalkaliphila LW7]|uniref:Dihydropteroate synthase n=1 Tax=Nitritalea halalkaliphila LW7 TaxID=1189621 RepID=I5BY64_9BACT|nr:dihydropteroate synthase [Nitritalea halalkaliphila LW7]